VLTLVCPFCRHEHTDDFECLEDERADTIRCENPDCKQGVRVSSARVPRLRRREACYLGGNADGGGAGGFVLASIAGRPSEASQEAEGENPTQPVQ